MEREAIELSAQEREELTALGIQLRTATVTSTVHGQESSHETAYLEEAEYELWKRDPDAFLQQMKKDNPQ
jgi:hypothetical protein